MYDNMVCKIFLFLKYIKSANEYQLMNKEEVYTVGHSNHEFAYFLELLQYQNIDCLIDVRSTPMSGYSPQYNQQPLKHQLEMHEIRYLHFKEEFGARHEHDHVLNEDGQVNFELVRKTDEFQSGVSRLVQGLEKGYRIALMCSEGNPLDCHRFSMISVYLEELGYAVQHILKDKRMKTHQELEQELLNQYKKKLPVPSLFEPDVNEDDRLKAAYELHNKDIGWKKDNKIKVEETHD